MSRPCMQQPADKANTQLNCQKHALPMPRPHSRLASLPHFSSARANVSRLQTPLTPSSLK